MSLPCQIEDCSSLSTGSTRPSAVPRRTSARSRKETAEEEVLVIVTRLATSCPSGPGRRLVAAVAVMADLGRVWSACRLAYWDITPDGSPSVLAQLTTSGTVDSQYTFRSTIFPCWLSCSSTKYTWAWADAGTLGVSTLLSTCWLARVIPCAVRSSRSVPPRLYTLASTDRPGCRAPVRLSSVTVPL